ISRSRKSSSRKQKGKKEFSSMGPRSLDRGNEAVKAIAKEMLVFNGAAISRSRKYHVSVCCITRSFRVFNGAAISRSRKSTGLSFGYQISGSLQWGRDLSIAEMV